MSFTTTSGMTSPQSRKAGHQCRSSQEGVLRGMLMLSWMNLGSKTKDIYETITLLADNTQGLVTTKQTKPRPCSTASHHSSVRRKKLSPYYTAYSLESCHHIIPAYSLGSCHIHWLLMDGDPNIVSFDHRAPGGGGYWGIGAVGLCITG